MRIRGIAAVACVVSGSVACSYETRDVVPPIPDEAQSSRMYAADGTLLYTLHAEENRENVSIARVPDHVRDAVIAIEDERFYRHNGVDLRAIARAVQENADAGTISQGGSTITQQYVKTALLEDDERTIDRKLEEATLAMQLERKYTKSKILELYLNTVYFGNGAYGIQAAAHQYFDEPVDKLTLPEGALLAGLIQAPADHDPFKHPADALARRNVVLDRMVANDYLLSEQAAAYSKVRLELTTPEVPAAERYKAAYFVEEVKQWILDDPRFGPTARDRQDLLFGGGLRIQTTVDLAVQAKAEAAVKAILPDPKGPSASLVAIEPETGFVRAMVGGRDFFSDKDKFNLATQGSRQAGSSFKPLVLAAALERGVPLTNRYKAPGTLTIDRGKSAPKWDVSNYGEGSAGVVTLEEATVKSYNTVYAQLIMQVGAQDAMDTASRLGIRSPLDPYPASVLGSNDVTALDMTTAYSTFANRGVHNPPVLVTRISREDGTILYSHEPASTRVISQDVADTVTGVLQQVIERGTGTRADIGRPAAGKTGTAQQWRDAWFAGYTPDLAAAVWVGFRDGQISMSPPRTSITVTGGSYPAEVWHRFMSSAVEGTPVHQFPKVVLPSTPATTTTTGPDTSTTSTTTAPRPAPVRIVTVPDLHGDDQDEAIAKVLRAGFTLRVVAVEDRSVDEGEVAGQWPPSGVKTRAKSTVTLFVHDASSSLRLVPHTIGMTAEDADARLRAAGFKVKVVERSEPATPTARLWRGRVWDQDPPGAMVLDEGTTVTVWVNP